MAQTDQKSSTGRVTCKKNPYSSQGEGPEREKSKKAWLLETILRECYNYLANSETCSLIVLNRVLK